MNSPGFHHTMCPKPKNAEKLTRCVSSIFFCQVYFMRGKTMAKSMVKNFGFTFKIYHRDKFVQWSVSHKTKEEYTILCCVSNYK